MREGEAKISSITPRAAFFGGLRLITDDPPQLGRDAVQDLTLLLIRMLICEPSQSLGSSGSNWSSGFH
jgi:hypothetical protein